MGNWLGGIYSWFAEDSADADQCEATTKDIDDCGTVYNGCDKCAKHLLYPCDYEYMDGLKYAELSNLAYFSYEKVQQDLPQYKLKAVAEINNKETDTEGFIAVDNEERYIVVSMCGTESWDDVLTDLNIKSEPLIPGGSQCAIGHEGFVLCSHSVFDTIEAHLKPHLDGQKEIYLTGHSLGGALSCLIAYRLAITYPACKHQLRIMVYGCPPCGNEEFVHVLKELSPKVITCDDDFVSNSSFRDLIPYYKPSGVHLLPGGGHSIMEYITIMKEQVQEKTN